MTLELVVGIGAVAGGGALALHPGGSGLGMPLSMLQYSPFSDFLIPGLLLFAVIGCGHLLVAGSVLLRWPRASIASVGAGLSLILWIGVQVAMLRGFHWLHGVYLVLGGWIVLEGLRGAHVLRSRPQPA